MSDNAIGIKNNAKRIMKIVLESPSHPSVREVIEYPDELKTNLIERERALTKGAIHGKVHEILLDGICIEQRNVYLPEPLEMMVEHDFPFLKMHFELCGHSSYIPNNTQSLAVDIPGGHHQLFFFPEVKGHLYYPSTPCRSTLEITLSHTFVKRIFHNEWEILNRLDKAIESNYPVILGNSSKKISPELYMVIRQILDCPIEGIMKRPYLAAKVTELFILQLQELTETILHPRQEHLSTHDIKSLTEVKNYISKNLKEKCTILQLSKAAGMNRLKLKQGFKLAFSMTIFEYLTMVRMKEAMRLLQTSNLLIHEVANAVGYKHSQHFAKAFRKHYGTLPHCTRQKSFPD